MDGKNPSFRIIYCGSITPRKGLHYLLQAFEELSLYGAELWIVGTSTDIEYIQHLKNSYISKTIIYKGSFPQSQLVHIYNECSVFVLPSIADELNKTKEIKYIDITDLESNSESILDLESNSNIDSDLENSKSSFFSI
jgi:glycosyltransferase involved in cell wall biosynthesis